MEEVFETVQVGDKQYPIIKTGRAQADQVVRLTRWVSKHGMRAVKAIRKEDGTIEAMSGYELIGSLIGELSADALLDLYTSLIGCTPEESEVYFDVATLVDVAIKVYEGQPSVRRLLERFFSTPDTEQEQPEE